MKFIGNLLWFIVPGLIGGIVWFLIGILWCISLIGIPVGIQCFKFAGLSFFPFGKESENAPFCEIDEPLSATTIY
jgi:uncharacterized membrane protein YccF (DUF307 family)